MLEAPIDLKQEWHGRGRMHTKLQASEEKAGAPLPSAYSPHSKEVCSTGEQAGVCVYRLRAAKLAGQETPLPCTVVSGLVEREKT